MWDNRGGMEAKVKLYFELWAYMKLRDIILYYDKHYHNQK